jgi:hypothetical protein
MTETQFEAWKSQCAISYPEEGTRPNFSVNVNKQYSSTGFEKIKPKTEKEQEEEKSFFSKYWMHILLGLFLIPRLLGGEEEAEEGGQQAAAPAKK